MGGGTVVNWTNCLRTHDWVREEWAKEHGLEGLDGPEFDAHLDAVWERIGVNADCSDLSGPHLRLKEGAEALGYDFRPITRNADPDLYDPASAAYMGFGDSSGSKRSTAKTYLLDAQRAGARIISDCRAERILVEDGRAVGVEAVYTDPEPANGAATTRVVVRAPTVVVACGSLESPALLLRSGIGGPAIGDYLRLHPTAAITAFYAEPQNWCWGPPQAALSHEFADLGDGHGFLIEAAQSTTGLTAGAVPWRSGREHKQMMSRWDHAAPLISLIRDRGHGRVVIDADGNAVPRYPVTNELDIRDIRAGVEQLVRLHEAAGARARSSAATARRPTGAAATTSTPSSPTSTRARSRPATSCSSPPTRWGAAGWAPTRRPRSPTRGASCTTRLGSGSATRAPSRPPPGRTRC